MTSKEVVKELRTEIDKILQTGKSLRSYRIYQYLDMLEKDNPNLSECIKEWEERGFKYIRCSNALEFENKKEDITICILKGDENINITDNSYCYSRAISFELHNLIHKTLKALEEMKNE